MLIYFYYKEHQNIQVTPFSSFICNIVSPNIKSYKKLHPTYCNFKKQFLFKMKHI